MSVFLDRRGVGFGLFSDVPLRAVQVAPSQDRVGHVCAAKTGTTVRFRGRPRPQGYAKKESPSGYWGGKKLQWKGYPNECAITKPDDGGTTRRTLREGEEDHPEQAHARLGPTPVTDPDTMQVLGFEVEEVARFDRINKQTRKQRLYA